jgi:hypothetical protein
MLVFDRVTDMGTSEPIWILSHIVGVIPVSAWFINLVRLFSIFRVKDS